MLRPFIPARDHVRSRNFYEALGFVTQHADDSVIILANGDASFILQNFYVKELAENLMVQLMVSDCQAWWRRHDPVRVAEQFGTKSPTSPAIQSWGMTVGFIHDPAGVLWHITEALK